jgi:hypothetical protein
MTDLRFILHLFMGWMAPSQRVGGNRAAAVRSDYYAADSPSL